MNLSIRIRSLRNRLLQRGDRTGLTVPCTGCDSPEFHTSHLAPGALDYLARNRT